MKRCAGALPHARKPAVERRIRDSQRRNLDLAHRRRAIGHVDRSDCGDAIWVGDERQRIHRHLVQQRAHDHELHADDWCCRNCRDHSLITNSQN